MTIAHTKASRRFVLQGIGHAAVLLAAVEPARAAIMGNNMLQQHRLPERVNSSGPLAELAQRVADTPRRRNFQTVPFVVTSRDMWDYEAASEVLAYRYRSMQMWECTELSAPWINLMREAINGQVFSHGNPDFLAVAAVHGTAHLALFNQATWDRYKLAQLVDGKFGTNTLIVEKTGVSPNDDLQNLNGFYGPTNNNIISLQRRGAIFLGCHDSIYAIAQKLHGLAEFMAIPVDVIAADLTNNLIPDAVLVPSVVAFLVELQRAGFTYSKGD